MDYKELKTPAKPAAPKAAKAPAIVDDDDLAHSGLTKSAKRRNAKKKRQAAAVARSKAVLISVAVETVQAPAPAAPKARLCMVCGDAIDPAALFYDCAKSEEHTQCLSCFADYVRHCCNHYWAGKFPLRCPVPNCKTHVDDLALRHLLAAAPEESVIISTQPNRSLWSLYERSQLEAALADWSLQGDDTVVRCTSCNKYAEIFPKDYHSRANHIVKAMNAWKREREWRKLHPEPPKGMEDFPSEPIFGYMAQDFNDQAFVDEVPTAEQASRPIAIERYVPDPAIGMTGHFFECKTPECDASVCLRCNSFLSKAEQGAHVCAPDVVHELYLEVLDALAEASTKTCPRCKRAGMKDLACCNISCDCGTTWCYACAKVPNGDHFGYTMLQEKEKCPSYLQYKYGDDINGSHFNGDPQKALERFHVAIQMDAINKLKSECKEPALWDTVMRKHFPKGIWAPSMLEWFEKRDAYIKERRQKAEEAKNQNKPAAPAPAPQPAVHNDDDDVGLGLFD